MLKKMRWSASIQHGSERGTDNMSVVPSRRRPRAIELPRNVCSVLFLMHVKLQVQHSQGFVLPNSGVAFYASHATRRINHGFLCSSKTKDNNQAADSFVKDPFEDDDDNSDDVIVSEGQLRQMTVAQLRQQLRLRSLRVSGKKADLVDRLVQHFTTLQQQQQQGEEETQTPSSSSGTKETKKKKSAAQEFAAARGKKLVDVSEYIDADISSKTLHDNNKDKSDNEAVEEVWGQDAMIVQDLENPVVDNLSRTVISFKGTQGETIQAYVCATKDALKKFLSGGRRRRPRKEQGKQNDNDEDDDDDESPAKKVAQIQRRRENADLRASKTHLEPFEGADDASYKSSYYSIQDYADVGLYTATGAKVSSEEVEGVLFVSDVFGPLDNEDTQTLMERVAFECQPCVVMAPDLFRGRPWKPVNNHKKEEVKNELGQTYEEWREAHASVPRAHMDLRTAAAVLREQYGVSSVVLFGTCYGGGRALEASSPAFDAHFPVGGRGLPPPVQPCACIAWYPTRYEAASLFGPTVNQKAKWERQQQEEEQQYQQKKKKKKKKDDRVAIMALFAEKDVIPGATTDDATTLQSLLQQDPHVKDCMVKVFPGEDHGFAHIATASSSSSSSSSSSTSQSKTDDEYTDGKYGEDPSPFDPSAITPNNHNHKAAEVATLLSTAWMETYARVFLPTVGNLVKEDEEWGHKIEMKDTSDVEPYEMKMDDDWWTFDFASLAEGYEDHLYEKM